MIVYFLRLIRRQFPTGLAVEGVIGAVLRYVMKMYSSRATILRGILLVAAAYGCVAVCFDLCNFLRRHPNCMLATKVRTTMAPSLTPILSALSLSLLRFLGRGFLSMVE